MKIVGLCFSPNIHGNTASLLEEALQGARSEGAEIELWQSAGRNIQPCQGCWSCRENGRCRIQDDMPQVYAALLSAGGLIFGSPVYFYGMTAQAKAVIDRTIAFSRPEQSLANKVGGVIVTAGSFGMAEVVKDFYFYMVTHQIIPANYVAAYPERETGVKHLTQARQAAFNLGRQIVRIRQRGPIYPEDIARSGFAYGTHTR